MSAFDPRCFGLQDRHVGKRKITIASSRPPIEAGEAACEEREEHEAERVGVDDPSAAPKVGSIKTKEKKSVWAPPICECSKGREEWREAVRNILCLYFLESAALF